MSVGRALPQAALMVVRKRMATPMTTPAALAALQAIAGVPVSGARSCNFPTRLRPCSCSGCRR